MATRASQADVTPGLQRDAIGLAPVLFQSITHMAPAAAVAFSIIFAVTYAGGATPLAVILALVACLLVAISISQLAPHLPSCRAPSAPRPGYGPPLQPRPESESGFLSTAESGSRPRPAFCSVLSRL